MISELTDAPTAHAAIDAAETGHLVISSMRTTDPADTVTRLVSMFPDSEKAVVRYQLATQIQAIISQLLVETSNGGRVMACEVLTNNERAQEWVIAGEESSILVDIIKESSFHGMQTFDQALLKHVVERTVDIGAVLPHVRNTHEIRAKAMAAGIAT
jgi:twitching motility protein PilT